MFDAARDIYQKTLNEIQEAGLWKEERLLTTPQGAVVRTSAGQEVLNFCANNYLGLSSHPLVIEAAKRAIDSHGFGLSSVRFICGTQDLHKELEAGRVAFFGTEDTILYSSCFDANGGLFETLLGEEDAIISDALNHASIIDGIRLCKAERHRYPNGDMNALEDALKKTQSKRLRMVATDGVFSMDGYLAKLDDVRPGREIRRDGDGRRLARDRVHRKTGRGTPEEYGRVVAHRRDDVHARQGAGRRERRLHDGAQGGDRAAAQRSRPYLFSNTLAPPIVGASIAVFELLSGRRSCATS
jgi:glycine C-acetyltransferase